MYSRRREPHNIFRTFADPAVGSVSIGRAADGQKRVAGWALLAIASQPTLINTFRFSGKRLNQSSAKADANDRAVTSAEGQNNIPPITFFYSVKASFWFLFNHIAED